MEPIVSPGDYASPAPSTAAPVQVAMEPIVSPGDDTAPAPSPPAPPPAPQPPQPAFRLVAVSPPRPLAPSGPVPAWSIQVGAFATPGEARAATESASALIRFLPLPRTVEPVIGSTGRSDGTVLFRARLTGLSGAEAESACAQLRASGRACMVVRPDGRF